MDCIFLDHIIKVKLNYVYQSFDGRLIEVKTIKKLSLGRPKGVAAAQGRFRAEVTA